MIDKFFYKFFGLVDKFASHLEGAPKVARWHKQFARNILKNGKVTEKINNLGYKCYDTEDFKIGYKSFLNKTKPKFKNK